MSTVEYATTQAATIGVEHTLGGVINVAGSYYPLVDLDPMVDGDTVELRVKRSVIGSGTVKTVFTQTYSNEQLADGLIQVGVPLAIPTNGGYTATLKQTNGTGRTYTFAIEKL